MADANLGRAETAGVIRLTGEAGVAEAAGIRDILLAAVAGAGDLTVDVAGLGRADIAFFQLVYAAARSMEAKGGRLRLTGLAQGGAAETARTGGFSQAAWFAKLTDAETGGGDHPVRG
jgi:anti-anti-sigma regulatory factor